MLQAAAAFSLLAGGSDEVLIASSQTSLATFFTVVRSPLAAALQAPSSLVFALAVSLEALAMMRLHSAVAAFTSAGEAGALLDVPALEPFAGAAAVELLDEEPLLLLPQPASSAAKLEISRIVKSRRGFIAGLSSVGIRPVETCRPAG
ncbi:MAG TPA: hypothetical protein VGD00_10005 [Solirubrobacteraceae bacterium]